MSGTGVGRKNALRKTPKAPGSLDALGYAWVCITFVCTDRRTALGVARQQMDTTASSGQVAVPASADAAGRCRQEQLPHLEICSSSHWSAFLGFVGYRRVSWPLTPPCIHKGVGFADNRWTFWAAELGGTCLKITEEHPASHLSKQVVGTRHLRQWEREHGRAGRAPLVPTQLFEMGPYGPCAAPPVPGSRRGTPFP